MYQGAARSAHTWVTYNNERVAQMKTNTTIRVALLVDSPSKRAHGNAASRLALGLAETGQVEATLLSYSEDPAPPWLPATVPVHRLGVHRV